MFKKKLRFIFDNNGNPKIGENFFVSLSLSLMHKWASSTRRRFSETAARRSSIKKVFPQNSQKNTCAKVYFLIKLPTLNTPENIKKPPVYFFCDALVVVLWRRFHLKSRMFAFWTSFFSQSGSRFVSIGNLNSLNAKVTSCRNQLLVLTKKNVNWQENSCDSTLVS